MAKTCGFPFEFSILVYLLISPFSLYYGGCKLEEAPLDLISSIVIDQLFYKDGTFFIYEEFLLQFNIHVTLVDYAKFFFTLHYNFYSCIFYFLF